MVALRATVTFTYFPLMTLELIFDQNNAQLYALYVYCTWMPAGWYLISEEKQQRHKEL